MAASPLTGLYRGPRNLNLAVVLRFAVDAVSVQRAQNGFGWEGIWEERWSVVWAEYPRRRNQVRRCRHLRRIYADTCFKSLVQSFPFSISVAVDSRIVRTDVYLASHPQTNLLVPGSYRDEDVRSLSCSSAFCLE